MDSTVAKRSTTPSRRTRTPAVVGIGASAGGIAALQSLFQGLHSHPNLAFVVIQHLGRDQPSRLVQLITRWCALPVRQALDGEQPKRGHIYVASPEDVLTLEAGALRTRPMDGGARRIGPDTIDTFFESLAQNCGPRAIAVVLSGAGDDGAAGAVCVKRSGGIVIVQDPLTAMHDSMPRAAISHGIADYTLPIEEIAQQLVVCASPAYIRPESCISETHDMTRALDDIVGLIHKQAGFDLSGYTPAPVLWHVQQRMKLRRVRSFEIYEALLRHDPAELETLIHGIPIHVSGFFRDPPAWDELSEGVIKGLWRDRNPGDPIRSWTPACATGEEAYSVAMLLSECLELAGKGPDFQVFATDASPEIVARAGRGMFTDNALRCLTPQRRAQFITEVDGEFRVKRDLREKMVFATQDLLADAPLTNLDLVTCRNVLIYLNPQAIQRVLLTVHSALRVGGYLFLGRGEALSPRQKGFKAVSARWHIYRKEGPATEMLFKFPPLKSDPHSTAAPGIAHPVALEHLDLPSVLIDGDFQILRVYGDTENILRLPAGPPTQNLLELTQPQLVSELKMAVEGALASGQPVVFGALRLTPLQTARDRNSAKLLVSFMSAPDEALRGTNTNDRAATREWSEAVRISNEELDASREELQALNEELSSSNEQLNIANGDLNQVNTQLKEKVAELEMQSRVLSSGEVATLFLDQELYVQWFTSAIIDLFPLKLADVGRCITDLVPRFEDKNFIAAVREVMQTGAPDEAEVRTVKGRCFLRRIRPYLSADPSAGGVAVTFTDITERTQAESELRRTEASVMAQKEAFQAALNGGSLKTSLDFLVRAAMEQMGEGVRCAFYLADEAGLELHHITGMPDDYAVCVDGFKVGPDSLACGLAMYTGLPVITHDVMQEPRWKEWLSLAAAFAFRGCWSFPLETTASKVIGTLAIYHRQPRAATSRDLELAMLLTRAAALIISRHPRGREACTSGGRAHSPNTSLT